MLDTRVYCILRLTVKFAKLLKALLAIFWLNLVLTWF